MWWKRDAMEVDNGLNCRECLDKHLCKLTCWIIRYIRGGGFRNQEWTVYLKRYSSRSHTQESRKILSRARSRLYWKRLLQENTSTHIARLVFLWDLDDLRILAALLTRNGQSSSQSFRQNKLTFIHKLSKIVKRMFVYLQYFNELW